MKIKIGQPGTQEEMLAKDMARLTAIHEAIGNAKTPYTKSGKLPYYFDANGRYEKKETLLRLLDHARKIGAFDQIAIVEEPFAEEQEIDISDIPVRIAADESAHTDADAVKRMQMGYKAIALKAIAKTLSMTMKIAQAAHQRDVPCFCADLTVNPILVEWNKNIAARLTPFPGIGLGLLETNGHQNYTNWKTMRTYHPDPQAAWANTHKGVFELNNDYYARSGGYICSIQALRRDVCGEEVIVLSDNYSCPAMTIISANLPCNRILCRVTGFCSISNSLTLIYPNLSPESFSLAYTP